MRPYERSIKIAFDRISGEVIEADQVFDTKKNAFETRRQFHLDEVELYCCECDHKLHVSSSKYLRLHFKHAPNYGNCILTDGGLSPAEADAYNKIFLAKESPRHKELKNKIAERLSKTEGVNTSTITVDNKFIIKNGQKRKPDVYCEYEGKKIVFEIQLSTLSLRYILHRHEFYRENGIYLIWILDNFDVHGQTQMVKDIKYLTSYENFFKFDETALAFALECKYKFPYLTLNTQVHTKWATKSVGMQELLFDNNSFEVYYYNFGKERAEKETEATSLIQQLHELQKIELEKKRFSLAVEKVDKIILDIKHYKSAQWMHYDKIKQAIDLLDEYEVAILNDRLGVINKPAINKWIKNAVKDDYYFLHFILACENITLSVNERTPDGRTAFQEIFNNPNVLNKYSLAEKLFLRGYILTPEDISLVQDIVSFNDLRSFKICSTLSDKLQVLFVSRNISLLNIIESAKTGTMVGYNYKLHEWAAFGINAIQYYGKYWDYIELAFKKFGIWDKIISGDKNGTFRKKVEQFYSSMPSQCFDFDPICRELYPELFN